MTHEMVASLEEMTAARYSQIARYYASDWRGQVTKQLEREFNEFLNFVGNPPKKIADIGCGTGKATKYFAERGYEVVGVDLSEGMLGELVNQNLPESTMLILGNMKTLPLASQSLDAIWCMASLIHLQPQDKQTAIDEFYRVLKAQGILYLSVQNKLSKKHIGRIIESCFFDIGYDESNQFYRRIKPLDRLLSEASLLRNLLNGYAYLDKRYWFFPTKSELTRNLNTAGFRIIKSNSPFAKDIYFIAQKQKI